MTLAPQEIRTFFVSSNTAKRQPIFRNHERASLFIEVLLENKAKNRILLHEFVIMPDHFHAILTPAHEHSLEKCVQFLKGGYSFQVKKRLQFRLDIWQVSFNEQRIKDLQEYESIRHYIWMNPVRKNLSKTPHEYPCSSASGKFELDPMPEHYRSG
jgi:putative transposase